jgi:hypothetical protein
MTPLTDVVTGARVVCCVPLTFEVEPSVWLTPLDDREVWGLWTCGAFTVVVVPPVEWLTWPGAVVVQWGLPVCIPLPHTGPVGPLAGQPPPDGLLALQPVGCGFLHCGPLLGFPFMQLPTEPPV